MLHFVAKSLASMKSYPDTKFHVYWYIRTMVVGLREFKEEKDNMDKMEMV